MNSLLEACHFPSIELTLEMTESMRILIVEDEPRMLELLRQGLYEHGFTVMTAADGETGLTMATAHELHAIVLDIGLPRLDGCSLLRALRASGRRTPVLMLTARDTEDEIIHGLDGGADDYLTKPFSFPELVARLQSITRPHREETDSAIRAGDVVIDPVRRMAWRGSESLGLTRLELLLLTGLARQVGRCVSRKALIASVWGAEHAVGPGALDVLVNSLRSKLDAPGGRKRIGTVRGRGYIFRGAAGAGEKA
jgi:DNA-binding response OmpR family regulator